MSFDLMPKVCTTSTTTTDGLDAKPSLFPLHRRNHRAAAVNERTNDRKSAETKNSQSWFVVLLKSLNANGSHSPLL